MSAAPSVAAAPAVRVKERNLRNIELALLLFSLALGGLALVLVQFGALNRLDVGALTMGAVYAAAVLTLHIVMRFTAPRADPIIVPVAALINMLGIVLIYRIDIEKSQLGISSLSARQVMWSLVAIGLAIGTLFVIKNHRILQRYTYIFMLLAIVMLLLPLVPGIGSYNGTTAKLWVKLGPLTFQPSEFAKIALAIFFAGYLVQHRESMSFAGKKFLGMRLPRVRDLGPIAVVWAVSMAVLVFQRDLGTSLLYFGLFLVMLYFATGLVSWIWIGLIAFGVGGVLAYQALPYVQGRIHAWMNPFDPKIYNANGGSFQLVQGLFGQANGGLFGTGLGKGYPGVTPLARSDYIWTSLAEEIGLIGVFALLCLFLILVTRGLRVGFAAPDDFGKLLGVGISFVLALEAFIVIGGVTRVIPLTGLPTPFLASGGSSLLANWIIVALLLRITDSIRGQNQQHQEVLS